MYQVGALLRTQRCDVVTVLPHLDFAFQRQARGRRAASFARQRALQQQARVQQFRQMIPRYMDRHHEKAGITGWAQVNGLRGDTVAGRDAGISLLPSKGIHLTVPRERVQARVDVRGEDAREDEVVVANVATPSLPGRLARHEHRARLRHV